ncbi:MAG: hypothetical protein U0V48_09440 [Anaerolineales bacterium]
MDFDIFVSKLPESKSDQYTLKYLEGKLISGKYALLDDERAALTDTPRDLGCAWIVVKIVLDKTGELTKLQKDAAGFDFFLAIRRR